MKKTPIRTLFLTLALALGLLVLPASAAGDSLSDLTYRADPAQESTAVTLQTQGGVRYLFLPSSADLTALTLWFGGGDAVASANGQTVAVSSGVPFDLTALYPTAPANGTYPVTLTRGWESVTLRVMVSANVGSVYLTSADPSENRQWVEQDKDENKAKGAIVYLRPDGTTVYAGDLKQIKGRGNSTWLYPKKPYQIKLNEKFDLLEAGEEAESTWVLLANYCDETLIHNTITYDLAQELGMAYTPNSQPVDLYYDGEYRGAYLLCEKTEIGDGRVQIDDLEGAIEDANPEVEDLDDLATAEGATPSGNPCQYVTGLNLPEDWSGGYLLEMDYRERARAEKSWFRTNAASYLVVKAPEYVPRAAMDYISGFYQAFEDAVMNGGVNPYTGKDYREYVDLESLAKSFLLLELAQDGDAFLSSTYFYKPAGEDKLYAGPLWDFDSSYGSFVNNYATTDTVAGNTILGSALVALPSFRDAVKEAYAELKPLIEGTLLSTDPAAQTGELSSLAGYAQEMAASQRMDHVLWPATTPGSYADSITELRNFLIERHNWYFNTTLGWSGEGTMVAGFVDVSADAWYAEPVTYVAEKGLMNGVTSLRFDPEGTMTRAMAVTVLHRMAGEPAAAAPASFTDVAAGDWYAAAVAWAAENGITQGYPDGTFLPDQKVNRQELVTFFHRYADTVPPTIGDSYVDIRPVPGPETILPDLPELPELPDLPEGPSVEIPDLDDLLRTGTNYVDAHLVPEWAKEAFAWALENGILTGNADGTLDPHGSALRSQAAAMLQRFDQLLTQ